MVLWPLIFCCIAIEENLCLVEFYPGNFNTGPPNSLFKFKE